MFDNNYQYAFALDHLGLVLVNVKDKNYVYTASSVVSVEVKKKREEERGGLKPKFGLGVIDGKMQKGKLVYVKKKICRFILFVPL